MSLLRVRPAPEEVIAGGFRRSRSVRVESRFATAAHGKGRGRLPGRSRFVSAL